MDDRHRPSVNLAASCACGAVEVRVEGTVRAMLMCSCLDCQKATGTGHSTFAILDDNAVAIEGSTRSFERPAASGATFTQTFCPSCGTPIRGRSSRWPDACILPVGLFGKDTDWYAPTQLIFARSHREWDSIADGLPRHATYRQKREES